MTMTAEIESEMPVSFPYPSDFVGRVRAEYSDNDKVIQAATLGEHLLGKFLMEGMSIGMGPENIVMAFENGRPDLVLEDARAAIRRKNLYVEWTRLVVKRMQHIDDLYPPPSLRAVL